MAKKLAVKMAPPTQEIALRSGEFFLMPDLPNAPVISSQPTSNIAQYTWIEKYDDVTKDPIFQPLKERFGTYTVVKGTSVGWNIFTTDPSNINSFSSDENLKFVWKKDGTPVFEVNSIQNGKGVPGILLEGSSTTLSATGRYICEVSNQYGTAVTEPIDLQVVDPYNNPKLFRNLIQNGSAEKGLTNWVVEPDITSTTFLESNALTGNYASLPRFSYYDFKAKKSTGWPAVDFKFCQGGPSSLFYNFWRDWKSKDTTLEIRNIKGEPSKYLEGWATWLLKSYPSNIVPNEDIGDYKYAAFYPGMVWMDRYNKNQGNGQIGLYEESENQVLNYFTRKNIKFKKFGGTPTTKMSQIIDIVDVSEYVDGSVAGVRHLSAQFFAYVGAGITRYQIKATTVGGEQIFNWYVLDAEDFYKRITKNEDNRIPLIKDSVIEIIPIVDDQTSIDIIVRDFGGRPIQMETIKGPDAADVFAIKEKVYLPISLYPVVDLFIANNNAIKVFGQTYTTTAALGSLMSPNPEVPNSQRIGTTYGIRFDAQPIASGNNKLIAFSKVADLINVPVSDVVKAAYNLDTIELSAEFYNKELDVYLDLQKQINELLGIQTTLIEIPLYGQILQTGDDVRATDIRWSDLEVMDRNAAFFIQKLAFPEPGQPTEPLNARPWIPSPIVEDWSEYEKTNAKRTIKAYEEQGAAAMFGVGKTITLQKGARTIEVIVNFIHNSDVLEDDQPEIKGWKSQEIYYNSFGQSTGNSPRALKYGAPRCGITKIKLQLIPNNTEISTKYVSYSLPPSNATVLGLQKQRLFQDVHNTATPGPFIYDLIIPQTLPEPPKETDVFAKLQVIDSYDKGQRAEGFQQTDTKTDGGFTNDDDKIQQRFDLTEAEDANTEGRPENDPEAFLSGSF